MKAIDLTPEENEQVRELCENYREGETPMFPEDLIQELVDLHGFEREHPLCSLLAAQEMPFDHYRSFRSFLESVGVDNPPLHFDDNPVVTPVPSFANASKDAAGFVEPNAMGEDAEHAEHSSHEQKLANAGNDGQKPSSGQHQPGGPSGSPIEAAIAAAIALPINLMTAPFAVAKQAFDRRQAAKVERETQAASLKQIDQESRIERLRASTQELSVLNQEMQSAVDANEAVPLEKATRAQDLALQLVNSTNALNHAMQEQTLSPAVLESSKAAIEQSVSTMQDTSSLLTDIGAEDSETLAQRIREMVESLTATLKALFGRGFDHSANDGPSMA